MHMEDFTPDSNLALPCCFAYNAILKYCLKKYIYITDTQNHRFVSIKKKYVTFYLSIVLRIVRKKSELWDIYEWC